MKLSPGLPKDPRTKNGSPTLQQLNDILASQYAMLLIKAEETEQNNRLLKKEIEKLKNDQATKGD